MAAARGSVQTGYAQQFFSRKVNKSAYELRVIHVVVPAAMGDVAVGEFDGVDVLKFPIVTVMAGVTLGRPPSVIVVDIEP